MMMPMKMKKQVMQGMVNNHKLAVAMLLNLLMGVALLQLDVLGVYDVSRPTVVTTSWSPTYAKLSWTPKVNPFFYASPLPTLLNGMLLHTPSHMHDRFTLTST